MSIILKEQLKKYETKRIKAIRNAEDLKKDIFKLNPRLKEIEDELNSFSIATLKSILNNNTSKLTYIESLTNKVELLKKEKNLILESLGFNEKSLYPVFECSLCNDTGYINNTLMCSCLKQELFNLTFNKSCLNNLEKENFNNFDFNNYSEEINFNKYKVNISPKDNIKNILSLVKLFIKNFDSSNTKNLLFTGNTGLGKTFISNCIANEIIKENKTVLYQTAPIMLDSIIDYRFNKNDGTLYNYILSADLLIIDDLGTESINSMKFSELFTVINSRLLTPNTKTIISTNLTVNDLFSKYDERLVSRFAGYYNICKFFGDDIRIKKL